MSKFSLHLFMRPRACAATAAVQNQADQISGHVPGRLERFRDRCVDGPVEKGTQPRASVPPGEINEARIGREGSVEEWSFRGCDECDCKFGLQSRPGLRDRRTTLRLWLALAAFAVLGLCAGCDKASSAPKSDPAAAAETRDQNIATVDHPEQFSVVEVENREVADEFHMNGVVAPDVNRTVPVLSLGAGRAVAVFVRIGDDVKKGQVLLRISSPDLGSAFSDYQKAQADEVLSRKQLDRSKMLYDKGAIAAKDLEAAQAAEDKAKVDLKTAGDRVRILGGDPANPSPILDVRAPISGTVVEQNVTAGTAVKSTDNSPNLFIIANLSHVWVLCDVYEDTLTRVQLGDIAEVRLNALPDRVFRGQVGNISRVLDPNTRTAKVRVELDNVGGVFRSGMFVTATIRSRKKTVKPVVPTTAVIRMHDKDWVFIPAGGNKFRKTEVQLGPVMKDGTQQVLAGLQLHDKVVEKALQFANASEAP